MQTWHRINVWTHCKHAKSIQMGSAQSDLCDKRKHIELSSSPHCNTPTVLLSFQNPILDLENCLFNMVYGEINWALHKWKTKWNEETWHSHATEGAMHCPKLLFALLPAVAVQVVENSKNCSSFSLCFAAMRETDTHVESSRGRRALACDTPTGLVAD